MQLNQDFDAAAARVAGDFATTPIDAAARQVLDGQRKAAKASLYGALLENPDMVARAQQLGRKAGLPTELVQRNLQDVERGVYLNDVDRLLQENPAVTQFLTSPQFASLAHDDVSTMGSVERLMRQFGGGAAEGAGMGVSGAGRIFDIVQRNLAQGFAGLFLPQPQRGPMGLTPQAPTAESLAGPTLGADWMRAGGAVKDFARKEVMIPAAQQTFGDKVVAGLGQVAGQIAMLPIDRGAGLYAQGADAMGEKVDQDIAGQGAKDLAVLGGAAVTGITERWALDRLLGPLAVPIKNQIGAALARIGIAGAAEGGQEFSENVLQDVIRKALTNRDAEIDLGQSVEEGGVGAAVGGIVRTIVEGALHVRVRGAQARVAEQDAQALQNLSALAQASKLAQRDPATFQEFVKQAAQDGPVQDVYVNAQTFAQMASEAGLAPEQMPPSVQAQIEEALQTGGDLRIPIEEFAAQIAPTEYAQALIPHLKTDPLGMSQVEAQTFMQSQVADLQAQVEKTMAEQQADLALKDEIDAVRTQFTEQLAQANRFTSEVNASYANLLANFYAVTAAKVGVSPRQLTEMYPLRVQAESVTGAAQSFDQRGDGPFGPVYTEFKGDAQGAIAKLMEARSGEAIGALHHPEIGDIDLVWGVEGTGASDGYGVAKLAKFHPEVLANLQDIISTMEVRSRSANRVNLESTDHRAGVRLTWDSQAKNWLLTAFKKAGGGATDTRTDTAGTGDGGDTARPTDDSDVIVGQTLRKFYQARGALQQRGQIAFGQDITQVPSIITLLKGADLSTFLHESGHFFLEVQFDLASRIAAGDQAFGADTSAPGEQQIQADTQALLRWFGVGSVDEWFNLPDDQKRSYHEQFARGFEAYLFEGQAPAIELQGLFQRFRAWLVRVYKDFSALKVELSDEVRGVMDRMLATNEQIKLAEQGRSMLPLFASPEQAGMTTQEFAAYQALGEQATVDAAEDLQARTLRDMQWLANARGREIRRLQKEATARRAETAIEARREIMSQPVYRAWQFLTGKAPKADTSEADLVHAQAMAGWEQRRAEFKAEALEQIKGRSWEQSAEFAQPHESAQARGMAKGRYLSRMRKELVLDAEKATLQWVRDNPAPVKPAVEKPQSEVEAQGEIGKLALNEVESLGLTPEAVALLKQRRMTAKDGIHPDLVGEAFGFSSGDELVQALLKAEDPKAAVDALTDQMMLERYGDLSSPEAIARAADQAIHNDARARFVATELNALRKATGKPKVLTSAAREYAKVLIDRLLVRNVKPSQYAAAEVRAAKAAEAAMKAGDTAQAAAEKRNQLVNAYATKAAHQALDEVETGLRYLKKFEREGVRKSLDVDYLDQIDAILERFDLRSGQSLKTIDKRKALAKWISEQEELGLQVELPEKVAAEAFRQSYKDLSVEELRGLVDSVRQIEHIGRLKERLLTAQDQRRFADVVEQLVGSIEANAGGKQASNRTRDTFSNRAANLFKGFLASHRKVASLARELDGFKDAGPMWTYLIRSMNAAGDREATMRADATKRLAELLKPVLAQGNLGGKGKFFPSLGESINRGEQIVMALNMGNEGNLQRLLDGRGWTFEQAVPVMQNLSASDWTFVQAVWDFFESYRPEIAAKERRVTGREPEWVEPQPLTVNTSDGQQLSLRGGYFPIVYDARESGRAEQFADAEAARQQMKGAFVAATTRRSFTKSRAEAVSGRPLSLTWDALFRGANDVIHDLSWHEWVIDANRIVKNRDVDQAMRSRYGADVVQQFKGAVRDIAAGDAPTADALSKVLTPLRTGAAVAGLGFNLMNAMLQPLGLTQSMVRVGTRWVALGAAEWAKSPVGLVKQVHGKSEFMRNRARTMQRELNEIQSVVQGKGPVRQKVDALMFMPMQSLQLVADMPTWWGAYQKALAQAPLDQGQDAAERRAVELADQAVIDAQGGGQVKDLALIQRGGPLQKLFTVFYGYFSTAYNLGVERAKATNYRSPLEVMHMAWDFLLLYSVPAVLASLLKDAMQPGGGDEDDEKLARKLIGEQISYLMGLMVGLREITGAVQYATGTKQFDMAYGGPAGLRFFQELDKLGKQVGQGELDRALARSVVNAGGVLLHLPSGQINRTVDGVLAISEGKTENPAALVFGVQK